MNKWRGLFIFRPHFNQTPCVVSWYNFFLFKTIDQLSTENIRLKNKCKDLEISTRENNSPRTGKKSINKERVHSPNILKDRNHQWSNVPVNSRAFWVILILCLLFFIVIVIAFLFLLRLICIYYYERFKLLSQRKILFSGF